MLKGESEYIDTLKHVEAKELHLSRLMLLRFLLIGLPHSLLISLLLSCQIQNLLRIGERSSALKKLNSLSNSGTRDILGRQNMIKPHLLRNHCGVGLTGALVRVHLTLFWRETTLPMILMIYLNYFCHTVKKLLTLIHRITW